MSERQGFFDKFKGLFARKTDATEAPTSGC